MNKPDLPRKEAPGRADWMAGNVGLIVHWIPPGPCESGRTTADLNRAVNAFDVPGLLRDFEATGARWLMFTVGQNTGLYASPNSSLDRVAGAGHCSDRDLVLEIAAGIRSLKSRFISYLPGAVGEAPEKIQKALRWNTTLEADQHEFQKVYLDVIMEWAESWGSIVDGWWIDGCFDWPYFRSKYYNWPAWHEALRLGNPHAALAFNDGCFCLDREVPIRPDHDYLAGEAEELIDGKIRLGRDSEEVPPRLHLPKDGIIPGTQCRWHVMLPIDAFWGHLNEPPAWMKGRIYPTVADRPAGELESPVYTDENLNSLLENAGRSGGGVTFNVVISQNGRLSPKTIAQLKRLTSFRLQG